MIKVNMSELLTPSTLKTFSVMSFQKRKKDDKCFPGDEEKRGGQLQYGIYEIGRLTFII